ncbi:hypothetical protein B0T19DRAFT_432983 [Cercophora scortea]|uniref:Secreted protein n=1 Tax=Cercophora scortea TaxID=314031 RepID=A0AAE0M542_9PEZI|nr:hypothetical protein B0T19DRAFT_432983 [Cercophora scortea]
MFRDLAGAFLLLRFLLHGLCVSGLTCSIPSPISSGVRVMHPQIASGGGWLPATTCIPTGRLLLNRRPPAP